MNKPTIIYSIASIVFFALLMAIRIPEVYRYTGHNNIPPPLSAIAIKEVIINNTLVLCFIFFSGVFTVGIASAGVIYFNAILLSDVVVECLKNGFSVSTTLLAILPHGTLEFAAYFIAASLSFEISYNLFLYILGKRSYILEDACELKRVFATFLSSLILILMAALVECYMTPKLVGGSL